jgi:hypothetical protein
MTYCLVNHHITYGLVFVLVSSQRVMLRPATDDPASCEIRVDIRFLRLKTGVLRKPIVNYVRFTAKIL